MKKTLDDLNQFYSRTGINNMSFTQTKSPLTISDIGYQMVERVGLHTILEANWDRISYYLEENSLSKNPYDIQQFCLEQTAVFPEKFMRGDELNKIKLDAYNTGLPLIAYMRVVAVLVRDRYVEEHGIDVGEVDRHDPLNANDNN